MKNEKTFGWDVDVTYEQLGSPVSEQYHFRGCSEAGARSKARRKATYKRHSRNVVVVSCRPLTERQWIDGYGLGPM